MTTPAQPDPAAEMRAAAALLRERAATATAGPWHYNPDTVCTRRDEFYGQDVVQQTSNPDRIVCGTGTWHGGYEAQPDAAWIALMHPGVGEPIANWLDDSADGDDHGEHNPYALAVARALLGGSDD